MKAKTCPALAIVAAFLGAGMGAAQAQGAPPLKIGFVTTLSGPGGYLGQDLRDGFQLAMELDGGKLGGVPIQLLVEDDGLKPGQGKQVVDRFIKTEGVKIVSGVVFSNVAGAIVPDVLDAGGIFVSANAGPSNFAGRDCHKNYYVVSWQNDSLHESAGQNATDLGFKRAYILAPNYQAGKDALSGFKRFFKGQIVGETYTRLDQTDFAAELAQIRAANPDVVFHFHPGGLGIAFIRQYAQAGLSATIPMVVAAPPLDHVMLTTVGDAALGIHASTHWNSDFDNSANKRFVVEYTKRYNRAPTTYAHQGYDTALAIGAALKGTGGKVDDTDAFRKAMLQANFESTRGAFKFAPNQHPTQHWWATKVEKDATGKLVMRTARKVLSDHTDYYAPQCKL